MDTTILEVTDLRQWRYCGRIVWYRFCLPDIRPVTALMEQGKISHQQEAGREERRSLHTYGLQQGERFFDLSLSSPTLGLIGRVDLAIATPEKSSPGAEVVVVEYKDIEQKAQKHHKVQLAAYAMMLEEQWGLPVHTGFIYRLPTRTAERIPMTAALRRTVQQTIADIQQAIRSEQIPPPPASRRPCTVCEFRRFCNDVV